MVGFRVEKTNSNRDDFKVLMTGIMLAIFIMIGFPTLQNVWDEFVSKRPFITATVEVVAPRLPGEEPRILYDADPNQPVDGFWIASIVDAEDGVQLLTRTGEGHYQVVDDHARLWTWFAFFDNEKGLSSPGVPNVPFKVCVRYSVNARDSGNLDEGPLFCSNTYDPRT